MDKAEYENLRREMRERQEQYLRDNPEIGAWVKTKKRLLRFLQGYWILHFVLTMVIMAQQQSLTSGVAGAEIFKLLVQLFWIFIAVTPRGNWRLGIMLLLFVVSNFMALIQNGEIIRELVSYFMVLIQNGKMAGEQVSYLSVLPVLFMLLLIVMEVLIPFMLLVIAAYLMIPKKHRVWSEQAEAVYKGTAQGLNDTVNKR